MRQPKPLLAALILTTTSATIAAPRDHKFNGPYTGDNLQRIAYPIGGIGAGMFCLEGSGAISNFSIFNSPNTRDEPPMFAAVAIKGLPGLAKVVEGSVPDRKKTEGWNSALGAPGRTWGLARFSKTVSFQSRFPFAEIKLEDRTLPVAVTLTGWSPFIPSDADNSGLPVGAIEYTLHNTGSKPVEGTFTYSAQLFDGFDRVEATQGGFILSRKATRDRPDADRDFAVTTDEPYAVVDHAWSQGSWFDTLTVAWRHIQNQDIKSVDPKPGAAGATLAVPFTIPPGQDKTIRILFGWYVPHTRLRCKSSDPTADPDPKEGDPYNPAKYYQPWYSGRFSGIQDVLSYWRTNYNQLKQKTQLFTDCYYRSTNPPEVTEAVAANLCILKSPTILRQQDGRLWGWEGCEDGQGSCLGSCTHVWNYAQSIAHLFPQLERTLRETEFKVSQDASGQQMFRSALPIRPLIHDFYPAADGQLGGIMKVYRDWRISGDDQWIRRLYPKVKQSLDYCIRCWDPERKGIIEEPHHNTYDIEFWGPEPMCTSMYLGALESIIAICNDLGEDATAYKHLQEKGRHFLETTLYNGEYFTQKVEWTGLHAPDPVTASKASMGGAYTEEEKALLATEGPKYQYATGCLSDGMIGAWMANVCGLASPLDPNKIKSHQLNVFNHNFKSDLSDHSNPQRPTYAWGNEAGLLLCSWPKGNKPTLPFPYSDEVWTGIEYELASHLISIGEVKKGLEIVRATRNRYDGKSRNPFDEYEYGHWYARAMSSYALLQSLTGVRYDAVTKTLYYSPKAGDFTTFLSTNTGFGAVTSRAGKVTVDVAYGTIEVKQTKASPAKNE